MPFFINIIYLWTLYKACYIVLSYFKTPAMSNEACSCGCGMSATATVSLMIALVGGSLCCVRAAAAAVVGVARVPVRGCVTSVPDLSLAGLNTGAGMVLSASFRLGGI